MKILYHKNFLKSYKKRIAADLKLQSKFRSQFEKFIKDPSNPALRNHKLIGKKSEYWSFSVTGDVRVIYKISDKNILLYDVGSHNQIY